MKIIPQLGIKTALAQWVGRTIGLTDAKFWRQFYGTDTWAGENVNSDTAMQIPAFWACVRLIAQMAGTLPLGVYSRRSDGGRDSKGDHPLYRLLHDQPNADHTAVEYWEGTVACLCLVGNAFSEKIMEGRRLIALELLRPDIMHVERTENGALRYRYSDPRGERIFSEDKIFHVRGFSFGGDVGLSPLAFARQTLSAVRATDRAAATTFANGMRPSGWLVYKGGTLKPEQRDQARKTIIEPMLGAENAGKIGILEADFDWRQVTIPPEDAQLLETRAFGVEEVCRWFGIPPIMVGHSAQGQTMWGSGVEQIMLQFYTSGLRPLLVRIEQAIKRSLIAPEERAKIYAEFNVEGLLRADSAGRAALYSTAAQNGWMTRNEIRGKENLPSFEGGDALTVQSNLVPLEQLGQGMAQPEAVRSALLSWLQPQQLPEPQRPNLQVVK